MENRLEPPGKNVSCDEQYTSVKNEQVMEKVEELRWCSVSKEGH